MNNGQEVAVCPHCGAPIVENEKGWHCSRCQFIIWKNNAFFRSIGKEMTSDIALHLLENGRMKLLNCESKKTGKKFNATVVLTTVEGGAAKYYLEF